MLTIDDPEIERFINAEAERLGVAPSEVVRRLLDAPVPALRGEGPVPIEEQARRHVVIREVQRRVAQLPVLDDRPMDELLGYDEYGRPS